MTFRFTSANQHDSAEHGQPLARIFAAPIRLLEFNRPPMHPWLDVTCAETEVAILGERAEHCFTDEYGCEVIRG